MSPDQYPGPNSVRNEQTVGGTGTGVCCLCARRTADSTSQLSVAIRQVGGRMVSRSLPGFSGEYRRDRASGLKFWEPGR